MLHTFFVDDLVETLDEMMDDVRLKHPFLFVDPRGKSDVMQSLRDAGAALDQPVARGRELRGNGAAAVLWTSRVAGHPIEGMTLAISPSGKIAEVRLLVRPFTFLGPWRERLRASDPNGAWDLPLTVDTTVIPLDPEEKVDPHFPVPVAADATFRSPILAREVRGGDRVRHVVGHASAVYGARALGPQLAAEELTSYSWTGKTSGLPMEMASLVRLNARGELAELTVFMQPWPTVLLFRDRVRARLEGYLGPGYFDEGGRAT